MLKPERRNSSNQVRPWPRRRYRCAGRVVVDHHGLAQVTAIFQPARELVRRSPPAAARGAPGTWAKAASTGARRWQGGKNAQPGAIGVLRLWLWKKPPSRTPQWQDGQTPCHAHRRHALWHFRRSPGSRSKSRAPRGSEHQRGTGTISNSTNDARRCRPRVHLPEPAAGEPLIRTHTVHQRLRRAAGRALALTRGFLPVMGGRPVTCTQRRRAASSARQR